MAHLQVRHGHGAFPGGEDEDEDDGDGDGGEVWADIFRSGSSLHFPFQMNKSLLYFLFSFF